MHAGKNDCHDATKHRCDHHDSVNRVENCQKTQRNAISASLFVVE